MFSRRQVVAGGAAMLALPARARASGVQWRELELVAPGDGRRIPVRIAMPERTDRRRAFIVLSHGANGTFEGLGPLMTALARTHIVAAPLHIDTESRPASDPRPAVAEVWRTRVEDMALLVARANEIISTTRRAPSARTPIVAMGHSYGALVAQAMGGATVFGRSTANPSIASVVAISPPGPLPGFVSPDAWASMTVPMLVTTGTADVVPMIAPTWQAHLASFEGTKVRGSAAWVGRGVDHYFGRNIHRLTREAPDQSAQFAALVDISRRFIAATAESDRSASRWLARGGPLRDYPQATESWTARS
jgi:predicted dienelactone hydrolase